MASARAPAVLVLDLAHPARQPGQWEARPGDLRRMLRSGTILAHILAHPSARLLVEDLDGILPLKAVLALRLLTSGPATIEDRAGRVLRLRARSLVRLASSWLRDALAAPALLRRARRKVAALERNVSVARPFPAWNREAGVLFLRTDLCRGLVAGGSVAHLSGVLNELQARFSVDVVTSDPIPLLAPSLRVNVVRPEKKSWASPELHQLHHNAALTGAAAALAAAKPGCLVYQRYSVHNWSGASVARRFGLPFVLEFNGPELWVAMNWARPLEQAKLAERIERLNLASADLITVVSEPLRRHLLTRGVPGKRILVNPNGVDLSRYATDIDGSGTRTRYDLCDRAVIGFIGTFGPWHGAEILAQAFIRLLKQRPTLRASTRLLLIGDGARLPAIKALLSSGGCLEQSVLTGLVRQEEGARHLAACDILVLPTIPNADGSPFFGSPTKLFEYMAMGRAIIASDVGQPAEILTDGYDALVVPPSDPQALVVALEKLIDDQSLRMRLGATARLKAETRHSWAAHVARLLERIEALRCE
jgi:glycosyltransferase involved in cell wall biosynthesis